MAIETDFRAALSAFVTAGIALSEVMQRDHTGAYFTAGYPDRLPSFDEFVADLQDWRDAHEEPARPPLRATISLDPRVSDETLHHERWREQEMAPYIGEEYRSWREILTGNPFWPAECAE